VRSPDVVTVSFQPLFFWSECHFQPGTDHFSATPTTRPGADYFRAADNTPDKEQRNCGTQLLDYTK
jgi:hypothetical protein